MTWNIVHKSFFFMFLCSVFSIIAHSFIIWKKAAQASCKTASYVVLEKQERFGNTWEWVNDERTLFSGWTIPLKALHLFEHHFFLCEFQWTERNRWPDHLRISKSHVYLPERVTATSHYTPGHYMRTLYFLFHICLVKFNSYKPKNYTIACHTDTPHP